MEISRFKGVWVGLRGLIWRYGVFGSLGGVKGIGKFLEIGGLGSGFLCYERVLLVFIGIGLFF